MDKTHNTPERIYVVAGNFSEFAHIQREKWDKHVENWTPGYNPKLTFPHYVYVNTPDKLRGLSEINGFYYGSYAERDDIDEIRKIIEWTKAVNQREKEFADSMDKIREEREKELQDAVMMEKLEKIIEQTSNFKLPDYLAEHTDDNV